MIKFLDNMQLWIGCHWSGFAFFSIVLGTLLVPMLGSTGFYIVLLLLVLTFISIVYYASYAKERFSAFEKELIKKDQKALKLEDTKAIALFKNGTACKRLPKKITKQSYTVTLIYVGDKFLTISSKCPKFFMFKKDRYGKDKKWAIKTKCAMNKELYYSYIQTVYYDSGDKALKIVLTSGDIESVPCEKKYGDKAVTAIREKLRVTERSVQTNPIKG